MTLLPFEVYLQICYQMWNGSNGLRCPSSGLCGRKAFLFQFCLPSDTKDC